MDDFWSGYCLFEGWMYRHLGLPPFIEWRWFHLAVMAVSLYAFWPAFCLWRFPPSENRLRFLGVDRQNYQRIRPLARLACLEAAAGATASLMEIVAPGLLVWPIDIFILGALIFSGISLWRALSSRPTFNRQEFGRTVLAPIGLSLLVAIPAGGRTIRNAPRIMATAAALPGTDDATRLVQPIADSAIAKQTAQLLDEFPSKARDLLDDGLQLVLSKLPQQVDAITFAGKMRFANRLAMGGSGEAATVRLYEAMGLKYVKSQVGGKGIDAVFVKFDNAGTPLEVYVVETKVNTGWLSLGQMSDKWIDDGCVLARKKGGETTHAADLVERARDPKNGIVLHRHLMHHNLEAGVSTRYSLATSGEVATEHWTGDTSETLKQVFASMEADGACQRLP